MPEYSVAAHRLHPRLRVIGNGSGPVNACRSKVSAQVASVPTAPYSTTILEDGVDIAAIQAATGNRSLAFEVKDDSLTKANLSKRRSIEDQPAPDTSFVNVIIDVVPASASQVGFDTKEIVERISQLCSQELTRSQAPQTVCKVITRQNTIAATVPVSFLETLKQDADIAFISPSEPLKLDLPDALSAKRPTNRRVGKRSLHKQGADVIIGIIDVGGFDLPMLISSIGPGKLVLPISGIRALHSAIRRTGLDTDLNSPLTISMQPLPQRVHQADFPLTVSSPSHNKHHHHTEPMSPVLLPATRACVQRPRSPPY